MIKFSTSTFTLPSKHRKRQNIFQTTLSNNIQILKNLLTNPQVSKRTIITSSFSCFPPNQTGGSQFQERLSRRSLLPAAIIAWAAARNQNSLLSAVLFAWARCFHLSQHCVAIFSAKIASRLPSIAWRSHLQKKTEWKKQYSPSLPSKFRLRLF